MPNYRRACIAGALAAIILTSFTSGLFWLTFTGFSGSAVNVILASCLLVALGCSLSAFAIWLILELGLADDERGKHARTEGGADHDDATE